MQRPDWCGGTTAAGTASSAPPDPRVRVAGIALLAAHLGLVAWLALRPLPVLWVAPPNLRPLATVRAELADGSPHALTALGCGLLLLAPLGVLLPLAAGRLHKSLPGTCARTVSGSGLISAGIVLLQSVVPGHRVNIDSLLLNTAGVALVCLLLFPPVRAWLLRRAAVGGGGRASDTGGTGGKGGRDGGLHRQEEPGGGSTPRAARVELAP